MSTSSRPPPPGPRPPSSAPPPVRASAGVNERQGPPTLWLVLGIATLALSLAALWLWSPAASVLGLLVLTPATLGFITRYRILHIRREATPGFRAQPWQPKAASVVLLVNLIASFGHAYVIAEEIGKLWV